MSVAEIRIKTGDTVFHLPSAEMWTVAFARYETNDLAWCGWPEGLARISDCVLMHSCSPDSELELIREIARIATPDMRRDWARRELDRRSVEVTP